MTQALIEALRDIERWSKAYPLKVFPEPDLEAARTALQTAGITLDAVSASAMRHVITEVGAIARAALSAYEEAEKRQPELSTQDLVSCLRMCATDYDGTQMADAAEPILIRCGHLREAADTIERLTSENEELRQKIKELAK